MFSGRLARTALLVAAALFLNPAARAQTIGGEILCTAPGTFFTNTSSVAQNFILTLQPVVTTDSTLPTVSLSWTDAPGRKKSASMGAQGSESFAMSVAPAGTVSFSCSGDQAIDWQIGSTKGGGNFDCGSAPFSASGTLFLASGDAAIDLIVGITANGVSPSPITAVLSWTDSAGRHRSAQLSNAFSTGLAISLGKGAGLAYDCSAAGTGNWAFAVAP